MASVRHLQTGFHAGELDPMLLGRVDTEHYSYGLTTCENFVPTNEGPIVKRPGFEYIRDAAPTATWLSAFRFSTTQEYVIEWSEEAARFYTNGGRIESGPTTPYECAVPYAAAAAPELSTQQSFDRLYIDHADYPPAALTRTAATTFVHAESTLLNGPFQDLNADDTLTVEASAATGSVTLTASAALFTAGQVGSLMLIEAADFSTIKVWEPGMKNVVIGDKVRSDGKAYEALSGATTGSVQPTHTSGSEWDGLGQLDINSNGPYGVQWQFLHGRQGTVRITAVTSPTEADADVISRLPDQVTTVPTARWALAAFSDDAGWPSHVVNWKGRQVHLKGLELIASVVGDYGGGRVNFQAYTASGSTAADLAFRRTLDADNPPLWVVSDLKLLIGTATREIAIGAVNSALAVAGDNIGADPQSFYGCEAVRPLQVGTRTIFVERGGRRLRSTGYDFGSDRFVPEDLTAAARAITRSEVVQLAWQRLPHALLHAVRGDGQVIVHADTRADIKGFARTVLGGGARALSAVSVVGADGKRDELWLLVQRGSRKEIWKQSDWRELGDDPMRAFFVDCGTQVLAGAGQRTFTVPHLAGQPLAVLANGGVVPGIVADGAGTFTLPATSVPAWPYWLTVGLPYTATAVTLRPELRTDGGSIQGLRQRVRKAVLRVLETFGVTAGSLTGVLEDIRDRAGSDRMDFAVPLFTGDTQGSIDSEFTRDGRVRFVSADPLPAVIAAAMLSMDVDTNDA